MPEYVVEIPIHFHCELPLDDEQADKLADEIGDAIIDVLRASQIEHVAAESFELHGWSQAEVLTADAAAAESEEFHRYDHDEEE